MASIDIELGVTPSNTYSIGGKQIKFNSETDIELYIKELNEKHGLKKVNFSGNTIGIAASKLLSEALVKHEGLVEIDFSDMYTGRLNTEIPQSLQYLLPALLKLPNLKAINLSDNAFGLQTIDPIEEYISKAVTIEYLVLSNNGMGPFAGSRIGTSLYKLAMAKKRAKKPSLKMFICGRNRLENGSINHLSVGLRNHDDLSTVKLYQNGIRPAGIEKLVLEGLSKNVELKVLDLQDNTITLKGSEALARTLSKWNKLQELNLNDALLGPKGALVLVAALEKLPKDLLEVLKLQYNELEADALKVLVGVVKQSLPNLKVLELNGNRFEEDAPEIEAINEVFESRGFGTLDVLDELEEPDSEEEEEEEEEAAEDTLEDDADLDELEKELENKSEVHDTEVDELTDKLTASKLV